LAQRGMTVRRVCLAIIVSTILWVDVGLAAERPIQWEQLADALRAYFEYPSSENAKAAYQCLPKSGHANMFGLDIEKETLELFYTNARLLERQVISGDAEAVRLAYRLFSITDSAYTEELDVLLGKLIRINPRLFLSELRENQKLVGLGGLLGNHGDEYVDLIRAQCLENRLRWKALKSVTDSSLLRKRDECIRELDRQWQAYCSANNRLQLDGLQPSASGHH